MPTREGLCDVGEIQDRAKGATGRKRRLERLIPASVGALNRVPCFEAACGLDLEGIVAKRKADPYGPKTVWYKIKNPTYTQAEGRRELFERNRSDISATPDDKSP